MLKFATRGYLIVLDFIFEINSCYQRLSLLDNDPIEYALIVIDQNKLINKER